MRILCLVIQSQLPSQFFPGRFDQDRAIRPEDGWNAAVTIVDLFYKGFSLRVFVDVHPLIGNVVLIEKPAGKVAIRTPNGAVANDA